MSSRPGPDLVLHFVRHGESLANAYDRAGKKRPEDSDHLSDRGWEQARGLGRRLEDQGIELIVTSEMGRARETGQGIAETLQVPLEVDPDLHELRQSDAFYSASPDFGDTASLNWMPDAPLDFAEPGGESFQDMVDRVRRFMAKMEARPDERILVVSHFGFLHFLLGITLFREEFSPKHLIPLWRAGHANTGVTIFERWPVRRMDGMDFPGWTLKTWNDQAHL